MSSRHPGSAAMAEIIAARSWPTVFRLSPYAHELNPVEPVWAHLTQNDLNAIAAKLNSRPRKTLDFDTPADRLAALLR